MKIKRHKLLTYKQSIRALKHEIKQAEDESQTDEDSYWLWYAKDISEKIEAEENINRKRFLARSRTVKKAFADAENFIGHIQKEFGAELRFSKENIYPRQWMLNDPKIKTVIERRPIIIDFLNYIFNLTRRLSSKQKKEMFEKAEAVIGNKRFGKNKKTGGHPYATFVADNKFWQSAAAATGYSVDRLKVVLSDFCKAGIVKKLETVATHERGRPPGLYSDGYLSDYGKKPFLKNSKEYREALRALSQKNLALN